MSARISIQLLGPVRVDVAGAPLVVDTRKALALLAYLAVTGRPASRELLAALLWPESDGADARAALRRTLSVLKGGLGAGALVIDRTSVSLRQDDADLDLGRFRAALGRARNHGHDADVGCPSCTTSLEEALSLDRGEFMSGFSLRDSEAFDEWQVREAESHRRDLAGALERLARALAATGATERALAAGRRWLELDPLHEPAHRLLMELLARGGEPAAAIHQYHDCVRILDRELGVAPLPETTELYEAIRADRLPIATPSRAAPVDAPAIAPRPTLPLVGRDRELATLREAYRSLGPDGRLLIVEGEAGIGKTRLATDFAGMFERPAELSSSRGRMPARLRSPWLPSQSCFKSASTSRGRSSACATVRPELRAEAGRLVPIPDVSERGGHPQSPLDPFGGVRLVEGLAEVLTALVAGPMPGLLLVDDLNRADDSSLSVIAYLAHRLRGRPIGLLVIWRAEELDDEVRNRLITGAEGDGLAVRIGLGRLDRAAVAELAAASLGPEAATVSDRLFVESEGLPLYIAEALASPTPVGGPTPGGVAALLRSRIGAVTELARQLLSAAAVIGRSFELETVRMASGRGDDEAVAGLEELVRRGLIAEVGCERRGRRALRLQPRPAP